GSSQHMLRSTTLSTTVAILSRLQRKRRFCAVATTQFAVDCEIEQSQIALAVFELEPGSNRPHVFGPERRLGANQLALIPRPMRPDGGACVFEVFHRVTPQLRE